MSPTKNPKPNKENEKKRRWVWRHIAYDWPMRNNHFLILVLLEVTISWTHLCSVSEVHTMWMLYFIQNNVFRAVFVCP
jgi:hypothetical protein